MTERPSKATTTNIILALLAIYLIWGTTYYGIKVAVGSIPPLLMAAIRWLIPGAALYIWTRLRGDGKPTRAAWRRAWLLGLLLMAIGNGAVTLAEELHMPSGVAALVVATVPLWSAVLEWALGGKRPGLLVAAGLAFGLAGVAVLSRESGGWEGGVDLRVVALPLFGSAFWALGSLLSRRGEPPSSRWQDLGMQMLTGGVILTVAGGLRGEFTGWNPHLVTRDAALAVLYLSVFGSVVAMACYLWLLRATTPAVATTYAFVNPAVAVAVGAMLAKEPLTPLTVAAASLIVLAVALIVWSKAGRGRRPGTVGKTVAGRGNNPADRIRHATVKCDRPIGAWCKPCESSFSSPPRYRCSP